ncbi:hypothetical protein PC129_g20906 [Phytophthora cactorum]|uniref:Uncharacterized protein n=1 Tax=Phytophthora cactorum TaxID=29920 RepID=A0A8T1D387_9STRA|nr:hypothetical protein PC112_g6882 [Phytophthora cactorum]KAG2834565.1 hypothetical protein PC111_g5798 [Phytophthora cactorum]KAG2861661.1 hypothetical protein PC113_g6974 [Phytophthora cactorum]KAG2917973.1 hypothetical protein PC114_g6965 [Phytophthora cactorum]KAG2932251.1 hypothetical protein PC115_g5879 [Phytophthora cactorum]
MKGLHVSTWPDHPCDCESLKAVHVSYPVARWRLDRNDAQCEWIWVWGDASERAIPSGPGAYDKDTVSLGDGKWRTCVGSSPVGCDDVDDEWWIRFSTRCSKPGLPETLPYGSSDFVPPAGYPTGLEGQAGLPQSGPGPHVGYAWEP